MWILWLSMKCTMIQNFASFHEEKSHLNIAWFLIALIPRALYLFRHINSAVWGLGLVLLKGAVNIWIQRVYIRSHWNSRLSKIPYTIFQYESVHEGKKLINFTLYVETAITRRQNHMCDTTKIVRKYFNFDNSHFWE